MKTILSFLLVVASSSAWAQSTTPAKLANFGVDGELRAYYFNGTQQTLNDDWFTMVPQGASEPSTALFVIDTTGASALLARYASSAAARKEPQFRGMRYPPNSLVGPAGFERAWLDAVWIRDYSGAPPGDETAFLTSNKNGGSPAVWNGSTVTDWGLVGNKVDIADMMVHVRRAGTTATTPLWFFGGLSLQSTSGDRYFDFELYQTDIFYDRPTGKFFNYGPDAGHTTWQFDTNGNVTAPGDVIFNCHFGTNGLDPTDGFEARIWINKASLSMTPVNFDWAGKFDGASTGAQFGYASIKPKGTNVYYTGVQSSNNAWAGPFGYIDAANTLQTMYAKGQFLEIGVNLAYLGLDPMTILGADPCGLPFRRILVKTRQSGSFTSNLSDFVGPFDFYLQKPLAAFADVSYYCGAIGVSELNVANPQSASVYSWQTSDGHIVGDNTGPHIVVDSPGTYIVSMQLLAGCPTSGRDTITILYDAGCIPMANEQTNLNGAIKNKIAHLEWITKTQQKIEYFEVQRSINGIDFKTVGKVPATFDVQHNYMFDDNLFTVEERDVYYRLKMITTAIAYTKTIKLDIKQNQSEIEIFPNPANSVLHIHIPFARKKEASIAVFNISGALLQKNTWSLKENANNIQLNTSSWETGIYIINVTSGATTSWKKIVINHEFNE